MTWFTSTPVSFEGGSDFFCRDSGLLCKGFQSLGLSCKSVMPLPGYRGDQTDDLIRANYRDLEDSAWWRRAGAEKVVLYSWGSPRYRRVAEAVRDAGAKLFVNIDSNGIVSPIASPSLYWRALWGSSVRKRGLLLGTISAALRSLVHLVYHPLMFEPGRVAHLRAATAIGCVSPGALSLWRRWARIYAPDLAERMHLVPHPVLDGMKYDPSVEKRDIVIAVGRWDDEEQKRPALLADTISAAAARRNSTEFHIVGDPGPVLSAWHEKLPDGIRERVHLLGRVAHTDLPGYLLQSRVGLCTSSWEGFHSVSAEALCAGASIVAPLREELNSMMWFVSRDSGRLSTEDSAAGLAGTLLLELEAWDRGERNPESISTHWRSILSASAVAGRIRKLLE